MLIKNEIEIAKIIKKLSSFFDLERYSDFLFLMSAEFISKYGSFGFSFSNFTCVRFETETNVFAEIQNFLPENDYYCILLENGAEKFYKIEREQISKFLAQNSAENFVIFEIKMTWTLVYDRHRKLFGLGNYMKKKMKKNVNMRFGESKIMFVNADRS